MNRSSPVLLSALLVLLAVDRGASAAPMTGPTARLVQDVVAALGGRLTACPATPPRAEFTACATFVGDVAALRKVWASSAEPVLEGLTPGQAWTASTGKADQGAIWRSYRVGDQDLRVTYRPAGRQGLLTFALPMSFRNCTEAREAGFAPLQRGDPGYAPRLDRDGDGVGCE